MLANTKSEGLVGTLIDIQDAAAEISKICDACRTSDIDLTILLTHIGIEGDKKLAGALDPACGADLVLLGSGSIRKPSLGPVVMQKHFFDNIGDFLNLPQEEIMKNGRPIEVATNSPNVLEEYFKDHESLKLDGEARLIIRQ